MSFNYNRVTIAGNLTRDPEVRFLAGERAVAHFGIAINRRWKDKDGQPQEEAVFVDCEAWGRTAELVGQYLTKGSGAFIEGRLKLDAWEDKDGQKRSKLKVVADSVQFTSGKGDGAAPAADAPKAPTRATAPSGGGFIEDQPPFARFDMPA